MFCEILYGKPTMKDALGFIETRGWVSMVEAIDAMTKTAQVEFIGWQQVGGGLVTGVVRGDVASVQAAVSVGAQSAERLGEVIAAHVIPKPDPRMLTILPLQNVPSS